MHLTQRIIERIHDAFPTTFYESDLELSYRDALESMSLALLQSKVDEDIILDAIQTAIDAFDNNR